MTLWIIFAVMTAAAVFAVLWPLGRKPRAVHGGSDRLVYQDHRVRRRLVDAFDEIGHRLESVHGRRRIVRVVEEHEPRTPDRRDHALEVEMEG